MRGFCLVYCIALLVLVAKANQNLNEPKCNEPIEKSAVTKEAADAAAKVLENPPVYTSEIYSSKVKSKIF